MSFQTDLYDEMLEAIFDLTNRRDLAAETEIALRTATTNAHHSDFYNRDHVTNLVQLPNGSYSTALDIANLLPRFRGIESARPVDVSYNPLLGEDYDIEIVEIGDFREPDGTRKTNIAYVAGSSLNILTSTLSYGFLLGWYASPITKREQYNSWIAQLYNPVIIFWAASIVLSTNGNEEKAAKYMKQVMDLYVPFLKSNYLLGKAN